jgi:hypothetical protein
MQFAKRLLMVAGAVALAGILSVALAPRAVHAVVSTLVTVTNTVTANVSNPTDTNGSPIPLATQDSAGRTGFDVSGICGFGVTFNNFCGIQPIYTVPANYIAVLQQFSGICTTNAGTVPEDVSLQYTGSSGSGAGLVLAPGVQVPNTAAQGKTVYSQRIVGYAFGGSSGSAINADVDTATSQSGNPNVCEFQIAGYLIHQ